MSDSYLAILNAQPIPAEYWKTLSEGAWSKQPHHKTILPYHIRQFAEAAAQQITETGDIDPTRVVAVGGPDIPGDLDQVNSALSAISQADAMAMLIQFLRAERGGIVAGAWINVLHWLIICGVYAPERERYTSLRELVETGRLLPATDAIFYASSGIKWPLVITSSGPPIWRKCGTFAAIFRLSGDSKLP